MNDQELRALVRDAVARHLGRPTVPSSLSAPRESTPHPSHEFGGHASHAVYLTVVNTGDACVIEPAVPCDHCGYCKSHGH